MSCECEHDPVLQLLEELAAARGLRLVPAEPIKSPWAVDASVLKAELEALPRDRLVSRVMELDSYAKSLERAMHSARDLFEKINLPGVSLPNKYSLCPSGLKDDIEEARRAAGIAKDVLVQRLIDESLAEAFGETSAEEVVSKLCHDEVYGAALRTHAAT